MVQVAAFVLTTKGYSQLLNTLKVVCFNVKILVWMEAFIGDVAKIEKVISQMK